MLCSVYLNVEYVATLRLITKRVSEPGIQLGGVNEVSTTMAY